MSAKDSTLKIAFIDDSITFRILWQRRTDLGDIVVFEKPEDFIEDYRSNQNWDLIITDFQFAPISKLTGLDIAAEVRKANPNQFIVLCSNLSDMDPAHKTLFNAMIPKDAANHVSHADFVSLLDSPESLKAKD